MITIVQPDTDQLSRPWHRGVPIRVATFSQPAFGRGFRNQFRITHQRLVGFTRLLEPWPIHVEPGKLIGRRFAGERARKIEEVLPVKRRANPGRFITVCPLCCERYDLHRFGYSGVRLWSAPTCRRFSPRRPKRCLLPSLNGGWISRSPKEPPICTAD